MLALTATRLTLDGDQVRAEPRGDLYAQVRRHLRGEGPPGLVVLGRFGSGKTTLCEAAAASEDPTLLPCTVVPLRVVARQDTLQDGLYRVVGKAWCDEARAGRRILLLDGLDEVAYSDACDFPETFECLVALAGPRWLLTSRPGHFRTDGGDPEPHQVDVLERRGVQLLHIDDLPVDVVRREIGSLPGGSRLLRSVEGLEQLSTSPLLLHVVYAALPHIASGRPIQAWGVFDAWTRHALHSGPAHDEAILALQDLGWSAFRASGYTAESASFDPAQVHRLALPPSLSALFVTDLDGRLRFGHRSLYEFLCAAYIAPRLAENQGHDRDELSDLRISEAMRSFLVGRVPPMPVRSQEGRVWVPRGNFVAGGDHSGDERPLRIQHLAKPFWIAREPVTNAEWVRFLEQCPDDRVDAHYLQHWGVGRKLQPRRENEPVYNLWPEDADRYAAWAGARLPSADEWEKAVRGTDGRRWPWGDFWKPGCAVTAETGVRRPLPVHALGALGVCGLVGAIGGVFEYTATQYRGRTDRGRVVMGGCYTHPFTTSRASLRLSHKLSGHLKAGTRLAWDDE